MTQWSVKTLLGIDLAEFDDANRQSRRFVVPGALSASALDGLLSAGDLERIAMRHSLPAAMVRVWKDNKILPAQAYSAPWEVDADLVRYVDSTRLFRCFRDGATIVFRDLQRYSPAISRLGWDLSAELGCPVIVSALLGPPTAQAMVTHFDYHDIMIVQVSGTKEWASFDTNAEFPLDETPWRPVKNTVDPGLLDGGATRTAVDVLRRGDVMYLPRGSSHEVRNRQDVSLHLNISLHEWTSFDVAAGVLKRVGKSRSLRQPVALGTGSRPEIPADAIAEARRGFDELTRAVDRAEISWELYKDSHSNMYESPIGFVSQYQCLAEFDDSTLVSRRRDLIFAVREIPDRILVRLRDRTLRLDQRAAWVVRSAMAGDPVSVLSLAPDEGSRVIARAVLRLLVNEGVLSPVADARIQVS